jgi:hypothetical protein
MDLIYGKFDFKDDHTLFTGSSPLPFDALEVDVPSYFNWTISNKNKFLKFIQIKKIKVIPRIHLRSLKSAEEANEALQIWNESFLNATLYYSVYSGKKTWDSDGAILELKKLPLAYSYFFEWGQDDHYQTMKLLLNRFPGWGSVVDPDWHRAEIKKITQFPVRFKLHGWSKVRWIRRYGPVLSAKILNILKSIPNTSLVLSHSGRSAESEHFILK